MNGVDLTQGIALEPRRIDWVTTDTTADVTADLLANPEATYGVVEEILVERAMQDQKWGQQDHPVIFDEGTYAIGQDKDGKPIGGSRLLRQIEDYAAQAEAWKDVNGQVAAQGEIDWRGILMEEVYEALGERDILKAREEFLQVAAVAAAIVESIDREVEIAGVLRVVAEDQKEHGRVIAASDNVTDPTVPYVEVFGDDVISVEEPTA